ncbi:MAG: hypothetical protein EU539_08695 [Promethearchaeota archaeon]|nr:MAG: hypothetical protein EU539_08695 [Candidatus Lokiarchaeota archaeon]
MTTHIHGTSNSSKYNLDLFLKNLHEWVDLFKFNNISGEFSVIREQEKPSLYGTCDMVYNLTMPNELVSYLESHVNEKAEDWITVIQSYQDERTGWFKEGRFNYAYHFKEHSTAFSVSALRLLDAKPLYDFRISKKLKTKKKVEKWLRKTPEWGLLYWPGSHRGGGVAAIYATLGPKSYPHERFFDWYFEWLDGKADPEVGFWRLGWIHKIKKNRLTKHELGGAVHYYWIYEFLGHPIPYPEKVIDSTLLLQNELGTWDTPDSYCIDLDAIFCLTRCCKQANGYKKEEIDQAILKYLDHIVDKINDKSFFFQNYRSAHRLTGFVCAIAEIYKFMPHIFDFKKEWIQTLDITPWI